MKATPARHTCFTPTDTIAKRRSATSFQFSDSTAAIDYITQLGYVPINRSRGQHEAGRWARNGALAIVYKSGSLVAAGAGAHELVRAIAGDCGEPVGTLYIACRSPERLSDYLWCSHPSELAAALEHIGWRHWRSAEQEPDPAGHLPFWVLVGGAREHFTAIKCLRSGGLTLLGNDWPAWAALDPYIVYTEKGKEVTP